MRPSGISDRNRRTPSPLDRNDIREKTLEGQQTAAAKGNHGGRPKVIDDDMLTFAIALKSRRVRSAARSPQTRDDVRNGLRLGQERVVARGHLDDLVRAAGE